MEIEGFDRLLERKRRDRDYLARQLREVDEEIRILSEVQPHVVEVGGGKRRRRRATRSQWRESSFDDIIPLANSDAPPPDLAKDFRQDLLNARMLGMLAKYGPMDVPRLAAMLGVTHALAKGMLEALIEQALVAHGAGEFRLTPRARAIPELKELIAA